MELRLGALNLLDCSAGPGLVAGVMPVALVSSAEPGPAACPLLSMAGVPAAHNAWEVLLLACALPPDSVGGPATIGCMPAWMQLTTASHLVHPLHAQAEA